MCEIKVAELCTNAREVRLADGIMACKECERLLKREAAEINRRVTQKPYREEYSVPRTTPFGRLE